MKNPPAYQYYAADFDEDTASWECDEVGIYQRLLNYSWINGWKPDEGLPDDPRRLARIARVSYKKFLKRWTIIAKKFFLNGNGFLINRRLEEEREIQRQYREEQARKGKIGAIKRWKDDSRGHNRGDSPRNGRKMALQSSSSIKDKDPKKEPFQLPTKEEVNESSIPKIKEDLEKVCEHLYETEKFLKVHAFKNKMLKEGKYERAILHTLIRCSLKDKFQDSAWGYCMKVIGIENGNYNEYEYRKDKS